MFSGTLEELSSYLAHERRVIECILRELQNNGGGMTHLNRLVEASEKGDELITKICRMLVGRAWQLTENPVDLGFIDEERDLERLIGHLGMPDGTPATGRIRLDAAFGKEWIDTRKERMAKLPTKPTNQYRLFYPNKKERYVSQIHRRPELHGGLRALIVFCSAVYDPYQFAGIRIVAAGLTSANRKNFPIASFVDGKIVIGICGGDSMGTEQMPDNCFFLAQDLG